MRVGNKAIGLSLGTFFELEKREASWPEPGRSHIAPPLQRIPEFPHTFRCRDPPALQDESHLLQLLRLSCGCMLSFSTPLLSWLEVLPPNPSLLVPIHLLFAEWLHIFKNIRNCLCPFSPKFRLYGVVQHTCSSSGIFQKLFSPSLVLLFLFCLRQSFIHPCPHNSVSC